MDTEYKTETCPKCGGPRVVLDHLKKGQALQTARLKAKKKLREVAKAMKVSIGYISDLEHGRRSWNPDLEKRYRDAIGEGK